MKLGNATREYVANKQATGMVFETEACILRTFTEQLGANVAIRKIHSWLASLHSREEISRRFSSCVPAFHSGRASGAGCRHQRHSRMVGTRQLGDYESLCGNHSERKNGGCRDLPSSGRRFDNIASK